MKCGRLASLTAAIALELVGCTSNNSGSEETVTLSAVTSSGETGTATLTSTSTTTTQVAITTAGGADTGAQSAVIRSGTCGSNGTLFAELNNIQGQASVTTIASALSSVTGARYYIDVHSSTSIDVVVACGEIP